MENGQRMGEMKSRGEYSFNVPEEQFGSQNSNQ